MTAELITRCVKILIAFVLLWGGMWLFNTMGCSRIEGPEMTPTLVAEKNALIDPRIHRAEQLQRDDVIAYSCELPGTRGGPRKVTARVVGLPGDRVKMVKGEVFVNGDRAATGVAPDKKAADDYAEIFVPRDTVFVLCDNRSASKTLDSRTLGPIGCWAIVGKLR
jgi:signal peptidase I